jgi:hypothetical protein
MIRSAARCMFCAGVSWIAASTAFADGQIEIVRGTEVETHTIGSGSVGGRGPSVDVETRSYSMSPTERQRIRSCVDQVIRIYRDVLGVKVPFDFDIDLTVQGDARKYRRETRNRPILGYYRHSDREAVVSGKTNRAQVRYTAVHESSHAILMDQAPYVPAWLNEGLAEYFNLIEVDGSGARIPSQYERAETLAEITHGGGWPLETLFSMSAAQWTSLDLETTQLAYAQGWSLAYFFMNSESGRRELRALIAEFEKPGTELDSVKFIERIHPGGVKALEKQWRSWLQRSRSSHRY